MLRQADLQKKIEMAEKVVDGTDDVESIPLKAPIATPGGRSSALEDPETPARAAVAPVGRTPNRPRPDGTPGLLRRFIP